MNEYCFQTGPTTTVWVCAIDEDEAEFKVYETIGYDPDRMELIDVNFDI